jgi:putative ABC transport system permease protein
MFSDVRYTVRVLSKAPGFTLAVVLVLALAIGSNSAIFSALDQIVIRSLPYADPDRLVMLWEDFSAFGVAKNRVSPATFLDWRRRNQAFEDIAAYAGPATMDLSGGGPPEEVLGQSVTANLLSLVGVPAMLGRTFRPDEEHVDSLVVVLSHRLWQRRFNSDPNLAGHAILMNGQNYTVVGVMPRGFQFPDRHTEFWVPIGMSPQLLTRRNSHFLKVIGRVKAGRSMTQAQADMSSVARQLATEFPNTNLRVGIHVVPLKDEVVGESRRTFLILISAAGCVLLIACANIGNLLLVRASARRREMAMRAALGADPIRLLRQVLTENLLLAAAGGILGLLLATWSIAALGSMVPAGLSIELRLNMRMVVFSAAITLISALLFGIAPAIKLSQAGISSRSVVGDRGKLRDLLVVAEVAIALVLVICAGLMIETLAHLRAVDPGFRPANILTADINVAFSKSLGKNQHFYNDVLLRLRSIPGVKAAGLTSDLPYTSRGNTMGIKIEGKSAQGDLGQDVLFRLVSPAYLEIMGTQLKEGRFLEDRDSEDAPPVVVINETLARQYWPGESPLGRRIDTGTGDGKPRWMTIVGVVRDIRERGLDLALKGAVYVPFTQTSITFFQPSELAVATSREPLSLAHEVQRAVWAVESDQPVSDIRTMNAIVDEELASRAQVLRLLAAFSGLALLLAALGIYGVLSYVVSQRTREIGVRMAIGASRWDIVRTILAYSGRLTLSGLAVGIVIALASTRILSGLLYGISALDPRIFLVVASVLAAIALLASLAPTLRAARVDPTIALRDE